MTDQVQKTIHADTFLKRLKGLIKAPDGTRLLLLNCRAVHTFGMRKPIEVNFLNRDWKTLKKITLPPWRIAIGPKRTQIIVEII